MTSYTVQVQKNIKLTRNVHEITFDLIEPKTISFQPGQFITIEVLNQNKVINRAYSIVSPPSSNSEIILWVKRIEGGLGSNYLCNLKEGQEIEIKGFFGKFVLQEDDKDILFVGTGVGIVPLNSMIETLFEEKTQRKITLYFGVRHEKDLFHHDEFSKLAEENENFTFHPCISRPEEKPCPYNEGRVTKYLEKLENIPNHDAYICGSQPMIEEVTKILKSKGIKEENIYHERFY